MLIDDVTIQVKAGNGGNGKVSFLRGKFVPKGGPDGGNGGNGGSVFAEGTSDLLALRDFQHTKEAAAQDGEGGKSRKQYGKNALDVTIRVPVGTIVTDTETGWTIEISSVNQRALLARGGIGGRGNIHFTDATHQTPRYAESGTQGEEKIMHLSLKFLADIGLIGLPNAGKTSLLNTLTSARGKVADYPFTTLEPNLGVMDGKILADIPGLIEGAHQGRGLGIKFLKHIQKTKLLLHCIDASAENIQTDYETVRAELGNFDPKLLEKKEILLLTKADLLQEDSLEKKIQSAKKIFSGNIFTVSILDDASIVRIKKILLSATSGQIAQPTSN
ncbi:MAG: GTPase ObgE [bacterium]|nr:GTPase ObgE [bacterium]